MAAKVGIKNALNRTFSVQESNIENPSDEKLALIEIFKISKKYREKVKPNGSYSNFSAWKPCLEKNAKEVLETEFFLQFQKNHIIMKYL